jgi:hypothetical protein
VWGILRAQSHTRPYIYLMQMVLLLSKFHLGIIFVVSHVDVICKGKIVNLELKKHVQRHIKN